VACGYGSTTAARSTVALETLDTEGILLDCCEDDRLVLGLSNDSSSLCDAKT
jgi:hypothetical protein